MCVYPGAGDIIEKSVNEGVISEARIDAQSDLIIYATYVASHQPKGFMTIYDEECATYFYAFTKGKEKYIKEMKVKLQKPKQPIYFILS